MNGSFENMDDGRFNHTQDGRPNFNPNRGRFRNGNDTNTTTAPILLGVGGGLLFLSICLLTARLWSRLRPVMRLQVDDWTVLVATVIPSSLFRDLSLTMASDIRDSKLRLPVRIRGPRPRPALPLRLLSPPPCRSRTPLHQPSYLVLVHHPHKTLCRLPVIPNQALRPPLASVSLQHDAAPGPRRHRANAFPIHSVPAVQRILGPESI